MKTAALGLTGLGLLFLLLSGVWTTIFSGRSTWTQEKSARQAEVTGKIHNLAFVVNVPNPKMHGGQDAGQLKAELEQLKKERDTLAAEFTSAAETPQTVSKVLKWSGLSLAIIGLIAWYAVSQSR
jgi:hypothetical protein